MRHLASVCRATSRKSSRTRRVDSRAERVVFSVVDAQLGRDLGNSRFLCAQNTREPAEVPISTTHISKFGPSTVGNPTIGLCWADSFALRVSLGFMYLRLKVNLNTGVSPHRCLGRLARDVSLRMAMQRLLSKASRHFAQDAQSGSRLYIFFSLPEFLDFILVGFGPFWWQTNMLNFCLPILSVGCPILGSPPN